jgi:hypothetical protein
LRVTIAVIVCIVCGIATCGTQIDKRTAFILRRGAVACMRQSTHGQCPHAPWLPRMHPGCPACTLAAPHAPWLPHARAKARMGSAPHAPWLPHSSCAKAQLHARAKVRMGSARMHPGCPACTLAAPFILRRGAIACTRQSTHGQCPHAPWLPLFWLPLFATSRMLALTLLCAHAAPLPARVAADQSIA